MAVHIRLSRVGAKKAPLYRVVVADQRSPRGGRFIEKLGTYNPSGTDGALLVNRERLDYWRGRGAQPSHTLDRLLKADQREQKKVAAVAAAPSPKGRAAEKSS
jgi:small subunit ribosomal protein S16